MQEGPEQELSGQPLITEESIMPILTPPEHIQRSKVQDQAVTYTWRGTADYNKSNQKLMDQLSDLSASACLAFCSGLAEWVYWRLQGHTDFHAPLEMIEASWVAQSDIRYVKIPKVYEFEEREGQIDGVLLSVKDLVENALRAFNTSTGQNVKGYGVYLYHVARHVLVDKKPLDAWVKAVLARLKEHYAFEAERPKGEPVPRSAVDTTQPFDKAQSGKALDEFLESVDPAGNRYLCTPDEWAAKGLSGAPYRLA